MTDASDHAQTRIGPPSNHLLQLAPQQPGRRHYNTLGDYITTDQSSEVNRLPETPPVAEETPPAISQTPVEVHMALTGDNFRGNRNPTAANSAANCETANLWLARPRPALPCLLGIGDR